MSQSTSKQTINSILEMANWSVRGDVNVFAMPSENYGRRNRKAWGIAGRRERRCLVFACCAEYSVRKGIWRAISTSNSFGGEGLVYLFIYERKNPI